MSRPVRRIAAVLLLIALTAMAFALPAAAGGRPYRLTLTGAAERPTAGDPDGTGTAHITVNPGTRQVCWSIAVEGIELPVTAAHIHSGTADVAGPIEFFLIPANQMDADGVFSGCATASRSDAFGFVVAPEEFYVNVHNGPFPGGALRAQLG
jgi:CHRD domain